MYPVTRLISQGLYNVSGPFHPFGGAVDIIVVEQEDGTYKTSPWYVRFGKFQGVLKRREKLVKIAVNDVEADFHMYLDTKGEAYFLNEGEAGDDATALMLSPPDGTSSGDEVGASIEPLLLEYINSKDPAAAAESFKKAAGSLRTSNTLRTSSSTVQKNGGQSGKHAADLQLKAMSLPLESQFQPAEDIASPDHVNHALLRSASEGVQPLLKPKPPLDLGVPAAPGPFISPSSSKGNADKYPQPQTGAPLGPRGASLGSANAKGKHSLGPSASLGAPAGSPSLLEGPPARLLKASSAPLLADTVKELNGMPPAAAGGSGSSSASAAASGSALATVGSATASDLAVLNQLASAHDASSLAEAISATAAQLGTATAHAILVAANHASPGGATPPRDFARGQGSGGRPFENVEALLDGQPSAADESASSADRDASDSAGGEGKPVGRVGESGSRSRILQGKGLPPSPRSPLSHVVSASNQRTAPGEASAAVPGPSGHLEHSGSPASGRASKARLSLRFGDAAMSPSRSSSTGLPPDEDVENDRQSGGGGSSSGQGESRGEGESRDSNPLEPPSKLDIAVERERAWRDVVEKAARALEVAPSTSKLHFDALSKQEQERKASTARRRWSWFGWQSSRPAKGQEGGGPGEGGEGGDGQAGNEGGESARDEGIAEGHEGEDSPISGRINGVLLDQSGEGGGAGREQQQPQQQQQQQKQKGSGAGRRRETSTPEERAEYVAALLDSRWMEKKKKKKKIDVLAEAAVKIAAALQEQQRQDASTSAVSAVPAVPAVPAGPAVSADTADAPAEPEEQAAASPWAPPGRLQKLVGSQEKLKSVAEENVALEPAGSKSGSGSGSGGGPPDGLPGGLPGGGGQEEPAPADAPVGEEAAAAAPPETAGAAGAAPDVAGCGGASSSSADLQQDQRDGREEAQQPGAPSGDTRGPEGLQGAESPAVASAAPVSAGGGGGDGDGSGGGGGGNVGRRSEAGAVQGVDVSALSPHDALVIDVASALSRESARSVGAAADQAAAAAAAAAGESDGPGARGESSGRRRDEVEPLAPQVLEALEAVEAGFAARGLVESLERALEPAGQPGQPGQPATESAGSHGQGVPLVVESSRPNGQESQVTREARTTSPEAASGEEGQHGMGYLGLSGQRGQQDTESVEAAGREGQAAVESTETAETAGVLGQPGVKSSEPTGQEGQPVAESRESTGLEGQPLMDPPVAPGQKGQTTAEFKESAGEEDVLVGQPSGQDGQLIIESSAATGQEGQKGTESTEPAYGEGQPVTETLEPPGQQGQLVVESAEPTAEDVQPEGSGKGIQERSADGGDGARVEGLEVGRVDVEVEVEVRGGEGEASDGGGHPHDELDRGDFHSAESTDAEENASCLSPFVFRVATTSASGRMHAQEVDVEQLLEEGESTPSEQQRSQPPPAAAEAAAAEGQESDANDASRDRERDGDGDRDRDSGKATPSYSSGGEEGGEGSSLASTGTPTATPHPTPAADTGLELSLCRHLLFKGMGVEAAAAAFEKGRVRMEQFARSAGAVTSNDRLVVRVGGRYYPWAAAAPKVLGMLAFGCVAPPFTGELDGAIVVDKTPKKSKPKGGGKRQAGEGAEELPGRGGGEGGEDESPSRQGAHAPPGGTGNGEERALVPRSSWSLWPFGSGSSRTGSPTRGQGGGGGQSSPMMQGRGGPGGGGGGDLPPNMMLAAARVALDGPLMYGGRTGFYARPGKSRVRTLSPTPEQLRSLALRPGKNKISFSFTTRVLGKQQVDCSMFVWKYNMRVVITDVDGTITRSDVLGQVMPLVGRDWSQSGVARLFTAIKENGYELLFLSARSISQASLTRTFLFNLKQGGFALPEGPVVISPDGLFPSLYREVIRRAPHEFKIACLSDIKALFPADRNPFYAGFGNRDTDEISYTAVGISKGKIFTINPKGEVTGHNRFDLRTYTSLHELVHDMFPARHYTSHHHEQEDFNSWNFWKMPLPDIDDELVEQSKKTEMVRKSHTVSVRRAASRR